MPKRILLADDSITIQKVVELTFSEGDYQVTSVGNGSLALQKIREVRPDIALLDVIMPEVNGYEVCEKVKQSPETAWIPVLLLTGTFEPFDRRRAEAAGANGHLTKPFESQMLISKVEELIAASQHPVVEPERAGPMEIIAEGRTRIAEADPAPHFPAPAPEQPELRRDEIVPDRFDEFAPGPQEPGDGGPGPAVTDLSAAPQPSEAWDELAGDLVSPPPAPEPLRPEPSRELPATPIREPVFAGEPEGLPPIPAGGDQPAPPLSASPPVPSAGSAGLSSTDVDRIASKVVEQLSEKVVREIAWEVIPELAESLIRQRIRELEEKIARES
jgi:CheY-like chemotaxis protein